MVTTRSQSKSKMTDCEECSTHLGACYESIESVTSETNNAIQKKYAKTMIREYYKFIVHLKSSRHVRPEPTQDALCEMTNVLTEKLNQWRLVDSNLRQFCSEYLELLK